jgi:hypothetical protein
MRLVAIEDLGNGLSLIGRQRRNVDQRFDAFFVRGSDHRSRLGVSCKDDGTLGAVDGAAQRSGIIAK